MKTKWSLSDSEDLNGKMIIVTGGNSGLGYEAVQVYAKLGAKVIMACRSIGKGNAAKDMILKEYPKSDIEVMALDLSNLASIKEFTQSYLSEFERLDILLNNAGIMTTPYGTTTDGFEQQIGVNHFGHFALTGRLFNILKATSGSRIVTITSSAHLAGAIDFDNMMFEGGNNYTPMRAYAQSKLANLLFTYELHRKVVEAGLDIKVLAAHPGGANTNLARHVDGNLWKSIGKPLLNLVSQSAYAGSLPGIRASLDTQATSGTFYGPRFLGLRGKPVVVSSNTDSHNQAVAKKLWDLSIDLTGVSFDM